MNAVITAPAGGRSHATVQPLMGRAIQVHSSVARFVSVAEVCDLLAAAGPLTLADIADGLALPARLVAGRVRRMVNDCNLRQDEFGRYRLWGACATR
jgi:hypothetical protein